MEEYIASDCSIFDGTFIIKKRGKVLSLWKNTRSSQEKL
jgi:hypothetical protein